MQNLDAKPMQPLSIAIVKGRPPNFEQIAEAFPLAHNDSVVFAYGYKIYIPSGEDLPPSLVVHEEVHCRRQIDMGVDEWWEKYIDDGEFRYNEELLAHIEEYQHVSNDFSLNRLQRRMMLKQIITRLSGPLYGRTVSTAKAKKDILDGIREKR